MRRISLFISDPQYRALQALSFRQDISVSEIIRTLLKQHLFPMKEGSDEPTIPPTPATDHPPESAPRRTRHG